jgi:serine/threonine protein kinase
VFVSPANKNLRDALVRLNLCSDRDFRRCRRIVRKLARGIPAFDFVWIDALVQLGALTPYQAKILQSSPPDQLCVGRFALLQQLGAGRDAETFRARAPEGGTIALKRLRVSDDERARVKAALADCVERARSLESEFVVAPHSWGEQDGAIILLSREVRGPTCKELLMRRGRFPADVVAEIARQLAQGCAALEAHGLPHGQIRLDNVRVAETGTTVLVDAGVASALGQPVRIRSDIPPNLYDAIAPERIGTGDPITTASEIYAFGCLLWQLLAGRPPFPTGDPLAKLAAHQRRGVPDIRSIAPDVPLPLAEAVRACTHADPAQRPATFAGISRRFGLPNASGRQRLARFLRRFDSAAPAEQLTTERPARFPIATVAALLFVFSGAALFLLRHGATAELLRLENSSAAKNPSKGEFERAGITSGHKTSKRRPTTAERLMTESAQSLPPPNAEGLVELDEGCYEAEAINCVGDLIIRGTRQKPATIVVSDRPFRASCRKFVIEHVTVQHEPATSIPAFMEIHSQDLAINACTFHAKGPFSRAVLSWSAAGVRDPDAGRVRLTDTVFANEGAALRFATAPTRIEIDNCLQVGGGLLEFGTWNVNHEVVVLAQHLTLRQAKWLCCVPAAGSGVAAPLRLVLQDSAFDLTGSAALVRLTGPTEPPKASHPVVVTGRESVIGPNVPIVAWSRPGESRVTPLDSRGMAVEGLTVGDFQFLGPPGAAPSDCSIDRRALAIPRQSDEPPGIVAPRLASAIGRSQSAR